MSIIGVASVKIKPDLSEFRKELKAGLDSIRAEITVNVKADTDSARRTIESFVARQELKDITKKVDIDRSSIDRATNAFGALSGNLFKLGGNLVTTSLRIVKIGVLAAAAAAALSAVGTAVVGIAHGLAELGPAGFATGLGGLLTLASVVGTVKLGIGGIKKSFSQLTPVVDSLKASISQSFVGAFAPAIQNLKGLIPQLKTPLQEVATAIGGVATKFTLMLKSGDNMSLVRTIIDNSAKAVQNLGNAVAPLGHAFLEVGKVASDIFTSMTKGAGQVAQEFADKLSAKATSGQLEQSFRNSIEAVHQLFNAVRDFGAGVGNIFKALTGSGSGPGSFTQTLADMAKKFRDLTQQSDVKQFFSTIGDVVHILSDTFKALFDAIKPVLPVLADTARTIAEGLSGVIKDLAPLIRDVAKHFLEIVQQVAPKLMPVIDKIAGAFLQILDACLPLVDPLVGILDALLPLVDPIKDLVKTLVPPLVDLLKALAPAVEAVAKALGNVLDNIGPVVGKLAEFLAVGIGTITDILGITDGNQKTERAVTQAGNLGKRIGRSLTEGAIAESKSINNFVDNVILIFQNNSTHAAQIATLFGSGLGKGVVSGLQTVNQAAQSIVDGLIQIFTGKNPYFVHEGQAISQALGTGITSQQQAALSAAQNLIDAIIGIFTGKRPAAQSAGASISQSAAQGLLSGNPAIAAAAQAAGNIIVGTLSPVSLFSVGNRIGNSLAAGLQSAVSAVKAVLSALTLQIPLWKGPPAKDAVLLKPAGILIMQGLIEGITSQQDELQRVLGSVTDQFTSATNSNSLAASLSSSMVFSGDLAQPTVNVNVGLNEGALKGVIDVQIDQGNRLTRRKALAGGGVSG